MDKKLKILAVFPTFYPAFFWGGPIFSSYFLCREIEKDNSLDLHIITTDSTGPKMRDRFRDSDTKQVREKLSIKYCKKTFGKSISIELIRSVYSDLKRHDIVWVTSIFSFPVFICVFFAVIYRKPLVITPRGSLQSHEQSRKVVLKRIYLMMLKIALNFTKVKFHFTSKQEMEQSEIFGKVKQSFISANGVDLPKYSFKVLEEMVMDRYQDFDDREIRILYLGRLDPKKGIELLIDALSNLNRPYFLTLVGGGDLKYSDSIKLYASKRLNPDKYKFVGALYGDDKEKLLYNSDIMVLPSFSENYGLVIAEALSRGIPVISSKNTPWEEIKNKNAGWYIDAEKTAISQILENLSKTDLTFRAKNALNLTRENYTWDFVAREFILGVRDSYSES
jgi:glycosyltransferase involved in cell wall biosynthesis